MFFLLGSYQDVVLIFSFFFRPILEAGNPVAYYFALKMLPNQKRGTKWHETIITIFFIVVPFTLVLEPVRSFA